MNRARIVRENAGLSIGQACTRLITTRARLWEIEQGAVMHAAELDALADLYRVSPAWLRGEGPERDYATIDAMKGAENLSPDDRDTLAEFAASLPGRLT